MGRLLFRVVPGVRGTVAANQAQVLGRPVDDPLVQASTREAFALYARYWFDTFNVLAWSDERVMESFRFEGAEHVEKGLADGKGVIIALPHTGNWDVGGRAMGLRVAPVVAVAEHLKPDELFELFVEHRRQLGIDIIDLASDHVGRQLTQKLGAESHRRARGGPGPLRRRAWRSRCSVAPVGCLPDRRCSRSRRARR